MDYTYKVGILGGTFDRLHDGHKALLRTAFTQAEKVIVGISTIKLYGHKPMSLIIEDFQLRRDAVVDFLKEHNYLDRAVIIPIDDMYGNSLTERRIDAIFATEDNLANVATINEQRLQRAFPVLKVVVIPNSRGNDEEVITSGRIRSGEIDRTGFSYATLFTAKDIYHLPESLKESLRKPFGDIYTEAAEIIDDHKNSMIISVGDIVSLSLFKLGHQPALSIVDLKTRRSSLTESDIEIFYSIESLLAAKNTAGTIDRQAVEQMQRALTAYTISKDPQTIVVAGEEDLLTIPAILLAPLHSIVVYGQFEVGIIAVKVTEEKKYEVRKLFEKFD